ncbi:DUF4054 domain-containing protein [Sphingomonas sp.]|uniref:DUF4054 domain-containing protein n=1 Tax=Sphingomonas sp. TaxID=28214 RepID=UPI003F729F34
MTYTRATIEAFAAGFPAFAAITEDQYDFWATRAEAVTVSRESCLGDNMAYVTMLLTAHYLERGGIGTGAAAQAYANGMDGYTEVKSGSLSLKRAENASPSGGVWTSTRYGAEAWPYLKACAGGPLVTDTGALPQSYGYNGWAGPLPPYAL